MRKYLIVIDMQNDFITGSLGTPEAVAIVDNVRKKIKETLEEGSIQRVIFTRDTHHYDYLMTLEGTKIPKHCFKDTAGWAIIDQLNEVCDNYFYFNFIPNGKYMRYYPIAYINKKDAFGIIDWKDCFTQVGMYTAPDEIEIVGVCTDICVITNALILRTIFPTARIIVDASCCAGTTPEMHQKALDVMKNCLIEVINE